MREQVGKNSIPIWAVGGRLLATNPLALGFNTVEINNALRWKTGRYTEGEPMRDDAAGESRRADEFSLGRGAAKSPQVTERDGVELSYCHGSGGGGGAVADRNRPQYIKI